MFALLWKELENLSRTPGDYWTTEEVLDDRVPFFACKFE
jgi:hypothetical protein